MGPQRGIGLAALALLGSAAALARAEPSAEPLPVRGELTVEGGVAPRVGVRLSIDRGWHIHGAEVGEVGLPTRLAWTVDGARVGPTEYPAPVEFADAEAGIPSFGYAGSVSLASPLELFAWSAATRMARVDVRFLACKDTCIPGRLELARDVGPALDGASDASALPLAWLFGVLQAASLSGRGFVLAGSVVLAALLALRPLSQADVAAIATGERPAASASTYSADAVSARLREGRPVFAEFTADWCLTCKANERLVLQSDRVQAELARRHFAVLRADWTRRDEAIRRELARFGKAGVPLYVLWFPAAPDAPRVLPELISVDGLVDALREERADGA